MTKQRKIMEVIQKITPVKLSIKTMERVSTLRIRIAAGPENQADNAIRWNDHVLFLGYK